MEKKETDNIFIRVSDIPSEEKSKNNSTGEMHDGLSCFEAKKVLGPDGKDVYIPYGIAYDKWIRTTRKGITKSLSFSKYHYGARSSRLLLLTGQPLRGKKGSDGEPLLKPGSIKIYRGIRAY